MSKETEPRETDSLLELFLMMGEEETDTELNDNKKNLEPERPRKKE